MIPLTTRKPGKINPAEVKGFQRRNPGLEVDGKAGNQTWGQVLIIEQARANTERDFRSLQIDYERLRRQPEPKCSPWGFLAGLVAAGVAWLMTQAHVLGSLFG